MTEIYRIGGAQAVAALAFGTDTIAPVDKITGPGNAFVAEAKRQVFGTVGIDMIAGPSEILVVATRKMIRTLLPICCLRRNTIRRPNRCWITDSVRSADAVADGIESLLKEPAAPRHRASKLGDHGAIILVDNLLRAAELVNRIAPEHLELAVEDPDGLAEKITHAGAIF